jgi:hypothetical protein
MRCNNQLSLIHFCKQITGYCITSVNCERNIFNLLLQSWGRSSPEEKYVDIIENTNNFVIKSCKLFVILNQEFSQTDGLICLERHFLFIF